MEMPSRRSTQRSGDNSQNYQAETIVINGLSYADVRQIAEDVYERNFYRLADVAAATAKQRVTHFNEKFIQALSHNFPECVSTANDPDLQYSLAMAQIQYARTGEGYLGDLLVDLLVRRASQPERNLLQIVLSESLTIVSKLTPQQLDALSVIFMIEHFYVDGGIPQLDGLVTNIVLPLLDNIPESDAFYQHLEYCGCAYPKPGGGNLWLDLERHYPGLFSMGFSIDEFRGRIGELPELEKALLITCFYDSELFQFKPGPWDYIRQLALAHSAPEDAISGLHELYDDVNDIGHWPEKQAPVFNSMHSFSTLRRYWDNSYLGMKLLSSVGIALAIANLQHRTGQVLDMSVWIN